MKTPAAVKGARMLAIDDIILSGENMREDVGDIDELAWSIRKHGILQPLLVTKRAAGFLLVCGHRRLAAARRAGLTRVPVVTRDLTDDERFELMIVENVHRKHLSPLEEAHAFEKMIDKGATQIEIGNRIGKSNMYVSVRCTLLKCDEDTQQKVHRGELSVYKAVAERPERVGRHRAPDERDTAVRWQIYYIDRLIGWLEAGRIPKDDMVWDRLILLGRALKAFSRRVEQDEPGSRGGASLPDGVRMCELCGTVVGVSDCCKEHGDLCGACKAEAHGEAA